MPQNVQKRNLRRFNMKRALAVVMMSVIIAAVGTAAESTKMLSKKEVKTLLEKASTPEEHIRLAEYYRMKAEMLDAEANEHAEMADIYRANRGSGGTRFPSSTYTTRHCEDWAKKLREAAKDARALSDAHAEMAKR
jgi:hypothetical protein